MGIIQNHLDKWEIGSLKVLTQGILYKENEQRPLCLNLEISRLKMYVDCFGAKVPNKNRIDGVF